MDLSIRPSSAHRWIKCTKSPYLESRLPDTTNPYAAEGTAAHELAAQILTGKAPENPDKKLYEHVKQYIDFIHSKKPEKLLVEQSLEPLAGLTGTADCIFRKGNKLYVIDYKHGAGIDVDITANPQLLLYAIGALKIYPDCKNVIISIVQPRTTGIKKEKYSVKEIRAFEKQFKDKISEIRNAPKFEIGDHCRYCKAESICIFKHNQAMEGIKEFTGTEDFLSVLDKADEIETYIKAVRAKAFDLLNKGVMIPGWKLVQKRESSNWKYDEEKIMRLIRKYSGYTVDKKVLLRLKTMTDLMRIKEVKSIIEGKKLLVRSSSGVTMARVDDKRAGINNADDFNDGVKGE